MIKAEVLYEHGGVWFDADFFMEKIDFLNKDNKMLTILEYSNSDQWQKLIFAAPRETSFMKKWKKMQKSVDDYSSIKSYLLTVEAKYKIGINKESYEKFLGLIIARMIYEEEYENINLIIAKVPCVKKDKVDIFPQPNVYSK